MLHSPLAGNLGGSDIFGLTSVSYIVCCLPESPDEGHHEGVSRAIGQLIAPDPNRLSSLKILIFFTKRKLLKVLSSEMDQAKSRLIP
jgi:hypothetical protein